MERSKFTSPILSLSRFCQGLWNNLCKLAFYDNVGACKAVFLKLASLCNNIMLRFVNVNSAIENGADFMYGILFRAGHHTWLKIRLVLCPSFELASSISLSLQKWPDKVWACQEKVDTKLDKFYEFCSSNWAGERYPSAECIRLVL
jgi:hypothetical protein